MFYHQRDDKHVKIVDRVKEEYVVMVFGLRSVVVSCLIVYFDKDLVCEMLKGKTSFLCLKINGAKTWYRNRVDMIFKHKQFEQIRLW